MNSSSQKRWTTRREFVAFVVVGATNTGLTYALYVALLLIMSYPLAYSSSYLAGIALSYFLNARFVFREPLSFAKALQYPVVYFAQYFLGLGLLYLLVEICQVSKVTAPLVVVFVSIPVTFLMSRYVIRGKPARTKEF